MIPMNVLQAVAQAECDGKNRMTLRATGQNMGNALELGDLDLDLIGFRNPMAVVVDSVYK